MYDLNDLAVGNLEFLEELLSHSLRPFVCIW